MSETADHAHESAIEGLLCRDSSCKWVLEHRQTAVERLAAILDCPDIAEDAVPRLTRELTEWADLTDAPKLRAENARLRGERDRLREELVDPPENIALREALGRFTAYGAEPPEYPGLTLVPVSDIKNALAALDRDEP